MLAYLACLDLAFTYAMRNPELATELATEAHAAAIELHRPDLAYKANDLIAAIHTERR